MASALPPTPKSRAALLSKVFALLVPFLFLPSQSQAQDLEYGMYAAAIYQDGFATLMPVSSGSFVVGTFPGATPDNLAGLSREQILDALRIIPGSETTIDANQAGQFYKYVQGAFSSVQVGTQLFVFFSTGSTLYSGEWCLITGTDSNWFSPNPVDPFAFSSIELAMSGNRICAASLGWRYRNGDQTADASSTDDLGVVPPASWDFVHSYRNVYDANSLTYVTGTHNAGRISEGAITYWSPIANGVEAKVTQKFTFDRPTVAGFLNVNYIYIANFGISTYGSGSLWASKDGTNWSKLVDAPRPGGIAAGYGYSTNLPSSVLGSKELWIEARMLSEGWNIMAQYLRYDDARTNNAFDLKIRLAAEQTQPPVITSQTTAIGKTGSFFSHAIAASNNPTSYGATGLPSGLSVNASTGVISGTPTQSGLFSVQLSASNSGGTATSTLTLGVSSSNSSAPVVTGPFAATGYVGSTFNFAASASNNPSSFQAWGLPSNVLLNSGSGSFYGQPQSTGTYRAIVAASNSFGTGYAESVITILPAQPPPASNAFVDVGMVSGYVYTNNGTSPLLGGSFGLGYFASAYDFTSKSREQILSDITWMGGSLVQGGLIDAANPGQFYLSSLSSLAPQGSRYYAFLSTGSSVSAGNWFVLSGTEQGGWFALNPDGLSSTSLDLGYVGNTIFAGTSGWRFASGGLTSTGDESIVFSPVADTTPPSIVLLGSNPITVYRGGSFTDPGATVTDNVDATRTIYGSGSVSTTTVGSYTLTYSAQDAAGNAATPVTRTVNVVLNPSGDEDNDGLTNAEEATLGTSPYLSDSDADGVSDLVEVLDGTSPISASSFLGASRGLVGHFNGEDLTDRVKNLPELAPKGGASLGNGIVGGGFAFDGIGGGYTLPDVNQLKLGSFTVSFWFFWTGRSGPYDTHEMLIFRGGTRAGFDPFSIEIRGDDCLGIALNHGTERASYLVSSEVFAEGSWQMATVTFDEPTKAFRLYVNGQLSAESIALSIMDRDLEPWEDPGWGIGNHSGNNHFNYAYNGALDELRFYNRVLPPAEISQLYQTEAGDLDSDGDGLTDAWERGFGRYQVVQGNFTWDQAKTDAEARGGHLATVTSAAENTFIADLNSQLAWLGATDQEQEGVWKWITEEGFSFAKWYAGVDGQEPDNYLGAQHFLITHFNGNDVWGDAHNDDPSVDAYILEYGYPTDPTKADTDGDGYNDAEESLAKTDPNDATVYPVWENPLLLESISPTAFGLNAADFADRVALSHSWLATHQHLGGGQVHVMGRQGVTSAFLQTLNPPHTVYNTGFGESISINSDGVLFAQSPLTFRQIPHEGTAYLFASSGGSYSLASAWTDDAETAGRFSLNGKMLGDTLVLFKPAVWDYGIKCTLFVYRVSADGEKQLIAKFAQVDGTYQVGGVALSSSEVAVHLISSDPAKVPKLEIYSLGRDEGGSLIGASLHQVLDVAGTREGDRDSLDLQGDWMALGNRLAEFGSGAALKTEAGRVSVFRRSDAGYWSLHEVLVSPNPSSGENFGECLVLQGGKLYIGAPGTAAVGAKPSGAVYGYTLEPDRAKLTSIIRPSQAMSATEIFGSALAKTSGTLAVGSTGGLRQAAEGGVYLYRISDTDTTPPLIALLGDNPTDIYRGGSFADPGATVTDNVDATRTIYGSGAVDTSAVGSYTLTYSTQDATGNAATPVTRIVNVILNPAGDEDNDGLTNAEEATLGTSPYLRDTDSDGATDYREVGDGTNPLNAGSFNPLSKGLVAYYPFEGSANDLSGNKHNGSLIGSTLAASGPTGAGESLHIDGSNNSWMEIADTPELRPAGTTVSVWIYNNRSDNSEVRFVCGKDTEQMEIHLGGNPLNPQSGVRFIPINGCYVDTLSGVPTNQWYHLLYVAGEGSGGAKVYINGQKANVLQSGSSNGSQPLGFGTGPVFLGRRANGWSHLDGRLDNFRIYNRVLSDSEIKSLYFQESGGVTGVVGQALSEPVGATAATGLPPGLALNAATGVVSGVPTSPGLYEVKLTGQDGIERTRQFNILRGSQSAATVDIGMVAARMYADYFGTTLSGGSFGLGILPGGSAYSFTGKTRDQILSDFVWVNGSRINGQLVDPVNGGQFYVPSMMSSFDPDIPMYAFLSTGATALDGNWLVLGGPDVSWLTPDADNPLAFTVMELSLAGNRIYAGTDGWRYRNGGLVSAGDEDLGFIAPPVVTGGMAEATQAQPFSYQIVATGNPTTYAAAGLPAGLSINPATGAISGSSTQRGVFNVTLSASNAGWTRSANLQLTVKLGLPVVTNPGTQSVKVGSAFNYQVQANNEATAYAAQGLPVGLSINATTGLISGRAAQPGTYPVVVSATNTSGTGQASFELNASYDEVSLAGGETTFEVIEKNLTWHQAKADAEALGGRLAVFPTGDMYDRVIAEVRNSYAGHLWLGLTDEAQEGDWKWIDGSIVGYSRWNPNQPDNSGNEDYAHIEAGLQVWNDLRPEPGYISAYLLEQPSVFLASLPWSSSGMAWTLDTTVAHDGISSAKVQTTDGQSSYREYTVTGPKVVDFWWKVSSEQDFDFFAYSIDGVKEGEISGNADWEYRTVTLGAGEHTLRWTYTKDELGSVGSDAGWVDGFATYPAVANLEVRSATNVLTGAATIDFGSGGGTNVAKNLTFLNKGYVPMDVQISLAQDAPFSFRDGGGKTYELHLERGEEVDLELVMDTSTIGTKTAVMTIEAPDSQTPAPTLTLTGIALGGEIALYQGASAISHNQPTPVDLGFAPSETVFTVANEGNASNLLISDISVSSGFLISQMPSASVPPGGTTSFKVVSLDSQPGLRQGAVTIACNDLDNQVFVFPVQAKVMFGTGNQSGGGTSTSGAGGASGWDFATATLPSGQAGQALKTGATPHGGSSSLQGVFSGPGMLTWKWQVATQQGFDWLVCEVNGTEVAGISTKNAAWQSQAIRVPAGATVRWIYRKDASGSVGEDSGYVADLNFQKFNAGSEGYEQWAARMGNSSPDTPNAKTGLPAIFGWLGAWDPSVGPGTNHYRAVREAGVFKYRFPVSKTATGNARVEFSTDLRFPPQTNSWSTRGLQQSVQSEDSEKAVIEVTAPSQSKGFFRLLYAP